MSRKEAFRRAVGRPPPRDRGPGLEARLTAMRKALEPPRDSVSRFALPPPAPHLGNSIVPRVRQEAALGTRGW